MRYRTTLPVLALGFLLAVSASGQHHAMGTKGIDYEPTPRGGDPDPPEGCQGVPGKVTLNDGTSSFSPGTVTIDVGQPVCWTWTGIQHNITADDGSFTSGPPSDRGNFQKTFNTPGTYGYHCQVHGSVSAGMRGTVVVRGAGGGTGPGKIELASNTYGLSESAGTLTVTVARVDGGNGVATVKIATANGTAKSGKDFTARNTTLRWENGDQNPKTFQVPIKNDTAREPAESFSIKLTKATGSSLGVATATVTINDDDGGGGGCNAALTAPSELKALGQSAGEIRLTWTDESGAASAYRIERRSEGGVFEEIAAVPMGVNSFTDSGLPGGTTFQYRVKAEGLDGTAASSGVVAGATDGSTAPCGAKALCLKDGRFEATVEWRPSDDEAPRSAKRVLLPEAPGSGLFSASGDDDLQVLLKVHDGCAANGRYWIDFAAVTDLEMMVKVRDTQTGRTWVYFNPAGSMPGSLRDVEAFATCP